MLMEKIIMNKIDYADGFIFYNDSVFDVDLNQFKEYIDKQNQFLNENEITWVRGTILKGSGITYADWDGMASAKQCKSIDAFYYTNAQYESNKSFIDKLIEDEFPVSIINDMIDNGGCLFMVNLNHFIIDSHIERKSDNTPKKIELKKLNSTVVHSSNVTNKTSSFPKSNSKNITLADVFKLKRK